MLFLVAAAMAGCGPELPISVSLSGTVTLRQTAVESGLLVFERLDQPGAGPVAAEVREGRYVAPIMPVGKYRVSLRPTPPTVMSSADIQPSPRDVPDSDRLPHTTVDVMVTTKTMAIALTPPEDR